MPDTDGTIRVSLAGFLAVQRLLEREGLTALAQELSAARQVDFGPSLLTAGRLGLDVTGISPGRTTFKEGLTKLDQFSKIDDFARLTKEDDASVKVNKTLVANLQARIEAMPDLVSRSLIAAEIVKCKTRTPFECPREWPDY